MRFLRDVPGPAYIALVLVALALLGHEVRALILAAAFAILAFVQVARRP